MTCGPSSGRPQQCQAARHKTSPPGQPYAPNRSRLSPRVRTSSPQAKEAQSETQGTESPHLSHSQPHKPSPPKRPRIYNKQVSYSQV
ncbi:hypothetical protein CRENBAI_005358 [Crenichthys baileyi]|uniref:Uncharacterized protein n=1 Tax=Crenichthys baileyi TaxID=28760 RepID=A0AAV9SEY9_9TELE